MPFFLGRMRSLDKKCDCRLFHRMKNAEAILKLVEAALRQCDEDAASSILTELAGSATLSTDIRIRAIKLARSIDDIEIALSFANETVDPFIRLQLMHEGGLDVAEHCGPIENLTNDQLIFYCSALQTSGLHEQAISELEARIKTHRNWTEGRRYLADLYWQCGNNSEWENIFSGDFHEGKFDEQALSHYVSLLITSESFEELEHIICKYSDSIENSPILTMLAADAFSCLHQPEKADRCFSRIPAGANADFELTRLRHFVRYHRFELAVTLAENLVNKFGKIEAWAWLGFLWRLLGDDRSDWFHNGTKMIKFVDLRLDEDLITELASTLRSLHPDTSHLLGQSARGGTQTLGHLFRRQSSALKSLRRVLLTAVRDYIDGLPKFDQRHPILGRNGAGFRFEGAWSIRLTGGGMHVPHIHSHGWISSALYIALPDSVHKNNAEGQLQIGQPLLPSPSPVEPITVIRPNVGHLALFPSLFWHGTTPFQSGERLSIAFDVLPR